MAAKTRPLLRDKMNLARDTHRENTFQDAAALLQWSTKLYGEGDTCMVDVALVPCEGYQEEQVYQAVREGVGLLGGMARFFHPGERILLKPNLLGKAAPEKAVTTHPAVFGAAIRLLREAGMEQLSYGDSPGNPAVSPARAAQAGGIQAMGERYGVTSADFDHGEMVSFPAGKRAHSFYLCQGVRQADAVLNLPKMKTHALERITGAVKNLYGCVCGVNKAAGHASFPDRHVFAEMLADLNLCVKPRLHILDGIVAMEGNGPSSGTPTPMNVLLFSADPVALDSVFAALVHLPPAAVPTCVAGAAAGVGTMDLEQIRVLTPAGAVTVAQAVETYGHPDFDVDRSGEAHGKIERLARLLPLVQTRPQVDRKRCVACGICQEACPVEGKAVKAGNGKKARYDYRKCIRCYCCQEMCPAKAISVHRGLVNRLLSGK